MMKISIGDKLQMCKDNSALFGDVIVTTTDKYMYLGNALVSLHEEVCMCGGDYWGELIEAETQADIINIIERFIGETVIDYKSSNLIELVIH